jgi:hypothetical protein
LDLITERVGITGPRIMIITRQLSIMHPLEMFTQVSTVFHFDDSITCAV